MTNVKGCIHSLLNLITEKCHVRVYVRRLLRLSMEENPKDSRQVVGNLHENFRLQHEDISKQESCSSMPELVYK